MFEYVYSINNDVDYVYPIIYDVRLYVSEY